MKHESRLAQPYCRLRGRIASCARGQPCTWRTHPKGQQDTIEGALAEVRWVQHVFANRVTGRLVDGHLRTVSHVPRAADSVFLSTNVAARRFACRPSWR